MRLRTRKPPPITSLMIFSLSTERCCARAESKVNTASASLQRGPASLRFPPVRELSVNATRGAAAETTVSLCNDRPLRGHDCYVDLPALSLGLNSGRSKGRNCGRGTSRAFSWSVRSCWGHVENRELHQLLPGPAVQAARPVQVREATGCRRRAGGAGGGGAVPGLDVSPFISGLDKPWDIAWLPNGTVLVTERPGRLNVYVRRHRRPAVHRSRPSDVVANGEGGMMGLEVDPDFAAQRLRLRVHGLQPGRGHRCALGAVHARNAQRRRRGERQPHGHREGHAVQLWAGTADVGLALDRTATCGWAPAMQRSRTHRRTTTRSAARCCASIEMARLRPAMPVGTVFGSRKATATFREWHSAPADDLGVSAEHGPSGRR